MTSKFTNPVSEEQAWEQIRDLATEVLAIANSSLAILGNSNKSRFAECGGCYRQSVSPTSSTCFAKTPTHRASTGQSEDYQHGTSCRCAMNEMLAHSDMHYQPYSSSSVDNENVQSQSTGEETPVTGESSGESGGETRCERCTNCGQPASRAEVALTAGDTPAAPRDPQPTTIPESQVA